MHLYRIRAIELLRNDYLLRSFTAFLLISLVEVGLTSSTVCAVEGDFIPRRTDIDGNGIVNILDMAFVATAYGHIVDPTQPNPKDTADLTYDGKVNIMDVSQVAQDVGTECRGYDFDKPLDWNLAEGTWSVSNGSLEGLSNSEGLIYKGDMIWTDLRLTSRVKIAADSPKAEAAFCIHLIDSGDFYWAGLGCWGHRVSISRMHSFVPRELVFSGDGAEVLKDVWYNISIKVTGNTITLYVNGLLELTTNDSTYVSGAVGVRTYDSHVIVDYITLNGLVSDFAPPPTDNTSLPILTGTSIVAQDDVAETYQTSSFQQMKSYKLNLVVINFGWNKLEKIKGTYDPTYLNNLDIVVKRATDSGLYVILRSHKWVFLFSSQGEPLPIAYQAWIPSYNKCIGFPVWIPVYGFWDNIDDCQQAYVNMMQMLANHYKSNPKVIGFSLLGEPGNDLNNYWTDAVRNKVCSVMFAPTRLWKRTIDAIHSANPNAIVIFEGYEGRWFSTSNGAMVEKPDCPNIYAGQSVYGDGDDLSGNYGLVTQNWHIPYIVTEIGIEQNPPPQASLDWLDRTLNYCKQNNINWVHWNWATDVADVLAKYGVG
jgi:hypothetical protein